jgi:pimeloyl-ACP methyl ester carboxylesterase
MEGKLSRLNAPTLIVHAPDDPFASPHTAEWLHLMPQVAPEHWADFLTENEDAETGDVFVQLCLLGEVVYG